MISSQFRLLNIASYGLMTILRIFLDLRSINCKFLAQGSSFFCGSDEPFRCRLCQVVQGFGVWPGGLLWEALSAHMWWPRPGLSGWGERICFMEWGDERLYSRVCSYEVMGSPCPQGTGRGCGRCCSASPAPLFGGQDLRGPQRSQPWSSQGGRGASLPREVLFKKR